MVMATIRLPFESEKIPLTIGQRLPFVFRGHKVAWQVSVSFQWGWIATPPYLDTPVSDIRSWPGSKGGGQEECREWRSACSGMA